MIGIQKKGTTVRMHASMDWIECEMEIDRGDAESMTVDLIDAAGRKVGHASIAIKTPPHPEPAADPCTGCAKKKAMAPPAG